MKASIRLKIIGFTVCIVLLVGGAISLHAMYVGQQRILAIFERDSRETTALIASALVNDLYALDIRGLRSHLANARVNPGVIHTYVMDLEGTVLADGTPENTLRDQHLPSPFIQDILGSSGWISRTEEGVLKFGGPVLMPDGRRIGHLLVEFSSEEAYRIVRETAKANLYLTALFLGIGAVLALLASAQVSRPISAMVQTAGEIGRGNLESRVAVTRADELGLLAESINQMARDLSTTTVSRAYLDRIVTCMADALIVLGPDGTIQRINQATSRLLGYPEAELIGRPLAAVCPDGLVEAGGADGRPEQASNGAGERTFLAKDGRRIPVSFSVSAMRGADGELPGSVCLAQDITERKQAEESLRKANDELEKRVQERTAHLLAANEAQQVALRDLKRAEDHLSEQQAQLAGVIESAMEAIITIDEDDRVILFNRAAEKIFRLPAAEAIGRPVEQFIPERFGAAHEAGIRVLDRTGVVGDLIGVDGSAFAVRADGEEFPIEGTISRVEVRGETLRTIILRDISERLKTEDMVRKLSLAVQKTTESVFITNRDGIIEYVNPAFERLTGYPREEAIGRTPSILKSGEHDAAFYDEAWKTILSGQVFSGVFLNRKQTGEKFYEERSITPIRGDGQTITHFVAAGRDVTQRKRTEEALRRLNAQLEREAERIAHALHDEAGQFLTSAHITLADLARDLPEAGQRRVREVRAHLERIEEDLRRLSHELRPRILDDLGLDAALEFLADGVMKRTGIVVTTEVALEERLPLVVETTLYRLVQEALTNAAKHAQPTRISVRVHRDARTIRCAIRDDGSGFEAADVLARRGDPALGLVGTRDRVEALGGTLDIASAPGTGTELLVLIPVDPAES